MGYFSWLRAKEEKVRSKHHHCLIDYAQRKQAAAWMISEFISHKHGK